MANSFFHFKHFSIHQDRCAMKVTTDACLFGAWIAHTLPRTTSSIDVLDIGTGTGLLSLMLAQKQPALRIDALEIDSDAAQQARENITASPWPNQIQVVQQDVQGYREKQYDLIISNPPFYEDSLTSPDARRNKALHDSTLTLEGLWRSVQTLLKPDGCFALLLPAYRKEETLDMGQIQGFYNNEIVLVQPTDQKPVFRVMLRFSRTAGKTITETSICIKKDNAYTSAFEQLLKDYYLYL